MLLGKKWMLEVYININRYCTRLTVRNQLIYNLIAFFPLNLLTAKVDIKIIDFMYLLDAVKIIV